MSELPGRDSLARGTADAWRRHLGRERDVGELVGELTRGSLPAAFNETSKEYPERAALEVAGEWISHGELDRRAARVGGWLGERGIGEGRRVILCGGNSLDYVVAYLGILRVGAVVVLAGPTLTEHELRRLAEDSGAACAVAHGVALQRLSAGLTDLEFVVSLDGSDHGPSLGEAVSGGEAVEPRDAGPDNVALLAYTSGTTGRPKGVPLTHGNLLSSIRAAMRAWRWGAEDVLVHALPLSHQHGLGGVHATLLAGSRAVVHDGFDAEAFCAAVRRERATVIFAVPAVYEKLVGWEGAADFSTLRLAVAGSAALSPDLARRTSERLGLDVLERYGSTESGLSVSNPYDGPRRFGTVGIPLPGTELVVADDGGRPVAAGEDGEVLLRGPQVFSGYLDLPEATGEAFHRGGWFRTGDIGRVDAEDGYLTITGRSKDLIISGGLNVYPREVELALEEHGDVEQAAVVGVPSGRWGEEVVAFVVTAGGGVDAGTLDEHVRGRLSAYKCPKRFVEVEELPRNEMGKVQREKLVRAARGEDASAS